MTARPRLFTLLRDIDETGVSGTGRVAEIVRFSDGVCAMRWTCTPASSTAIYDSEDDLLKIHGHNGKTRMVLLDD